MTLQEAKQSLILGNKLTHRYFSDNEYIYQEGNKMVMEDGASISVTMFFNDRTASGWEDGWDIYEPSKQSQ